ncbi:hypothetical protein DFQ27_001361, partial [Actinomortierella ambigua]
MVSRGESANTIVFSFLRDFEAKLRAGVSKEVFGLLSYPFMRTAIRDHDVHTVFERLMIPINESHSWSWEATKKAFLKAVDQESAIGDAVARLYSIEPREKEDYKTFVSRIRELLTQVASTDNHINLMHRIVMCISSDGRAKVLEHFGDMKGIPSLEDLLDFLQKQVNHPYGPRSFGYRPSPHVRDEAMRSYPDAKSKAPTSTEVSRNSNNKRPRFQPSSGSTSSTASGGSSRSSSGSSQTAPRQYCRYCHKTGHLLEECFKRKNKNDSGSNATTSASTVASVFPGAAAQMGNHNKNKPVRVNQVKRMKVWDDSADMECHPVLPLYAQGILSFDE